MFTGLKKLLGSPDPLLKLARKKLPESFIHELCNAQIYVIAKGAYDDGVAADSSHTKIIAILKKEAERINIQRNFEIYTYKNGEKYNLPFFSLQENAHKFCNAMAEKYQKIFPFTVLCVSGRVLIKYAETELDIVMNDLTADQYILSDKDRALMIALASPAK